MFKGKNVISRENELLIERFERYLSGVVSLEGRGGGVVASDSIVKSSQAFRIDRDGEGKCEKSKQSFKDDLEEAERLKRKFEEFKGDSEEKQLFREYLCELIEKKRIERAKQIELEGGNGFNKYERNADVYKAAGVSRHVFSKIVNMSLDPPHNPSKETIGALSIGLELDLEEAQEFYSVAGYSLGETDLIDNVVRFFIKEKIYDIKRVTNLLGYYNRPPLGERASLKEQNKNKGVRN